MESRLLGAEDSSGLDEPGCARCEDVQDVRVCKTPGCARCCWRQCIGSCHFDPSEYTGQLNPVPHHSRLLLVEQHTLGKGEC